MGMYYIRFFFFKNADELKQTPDILQRGYLPCHWHYDMPALLSFNNFSQFFPICTYHQHIKTISRHKMHLPR